MLKLPIALSALSLTALIAGGAVASAASAPSAANDSVSVNGATTTFIDALSNDSPSDGAAFGFEAVTIVTQPAHGWAGTDPQTNQVSYIAPSNWSGTDTFSYQVTDTSGASATATVTVQVGHLDPAVVAAVAAKIAAAEAAITVPVS